MYATGNKCFRLPGICLILLFSTQGLEAQDPGAKDREDRDLQQYRWKNRLLVLVTPAADHPVYLRQAREFRRVPGELEERRLRVFTLTPEGFAAGLPPGTLRAGGLRGPFTADPAAGFRLLLVGLDGGVKLDTTEFVPAGALWERIDGMPMRRRELRNKGN